MVPLMQKELDLFKDTIWNVHRIRAQKDTVLPDGIPEHILIFLRDMDYRNVVRNILFEANFLKKIHKSILFTTSWPVNQCCL